MTHPSSSETASVQPLPCPFCGAEVEVIDRWVRHTTGGNECPMTARIFLAEGWNRRSPCPEPTDTETQRRADAATNAVLCAAIELTIKAIDAQDDEKIPRHAQVVDYAAIIRAARALSSSPSSGIATDDLRVVVSREDAEELIDAGNRTAFVCVDAGSYLPGHWPATDALRRIIKQLRSPLPSAPATPEDTTADMERADRLASEIDGMQYRIDVYKADAAEADARADESERQLADAKTEIARLKADLKEIRHVIDYAFLNTDDRIRGSDALHSIRRILAKSDASRSHSETPNG